MIAPDGTVFANRHRYKLWRAPARIEFLMDADDDSIAPMQVLVLMEPEGEGTRITQEITLPDAASRTAALGFGADRLGMQTLGKLAALAEGLARGQ